MTPQNIRTVIDTEHKYKREAQLRNGQATLIMVLMATLFVVVIVSVIAFIEILVSRFDDSLVFDIVTTAVIAVCVAAYAIVAVALRGLGVWPLHDESINDNNAKQYGMIMLYVPFLLGLLIALRWIGFSQVNGSTRFQDLPGGVVYSWVSQGTWFFCLMSLFAIISSMFTFYRQRQPIYRYAVTRGIPWSKQLNEIVRAEYDSDTNSTVLVPKQQN